MSKHSRELELIICSYKKYTMSSISLQSEFAKLRVSRVSVTYMPLRLRVLLALRIFVLYVSLHLTRIRALCVLVDYVPYLKPLSTRPACLMCFLKSFKNGFAVHQKVSIFERLLKAL